MSGLNCQFYCLSFNDEERNNNMIRRFEHFNINCIFYRGVQYDDNRLINRNLSNSLIREWCCCYGHLDMIYDFYYKSDKRFGIFCENDIHIHKDLIDILPKILNDFNILNLDILLLGCLIPFTIDKNNVNFSLKRETNAKSLFTYHNYPDDLVGTQMYILSRKHAKNLIDKYYYDYADKNLESESNHSIFKSDNIIIKDGNRALIYPILAVEEKSTPDDLHLTCHTIHYKKAIFI